MLALIILLSMQLYYYRWWIQWPRIYILYQIISVLILLGGFCFAVFSGGYDVVGCKSESEICTGNCPACSAMAWFIYIGAWTNPIMFAIISMNVLLTILKVVTTRVQLFLNVFYHFCIIVPPVVILIVLQSLGYNGYSDGTAACVFKISVEIDGLGTNGLGVLLLLMPTSFMLVIGFAALLVTFVVVWKLSGSEGLLKQKRLLAFLASFGSALILTEIVLYETAINGTGPPTEYLTCLVTNWVQDLVNGPQQTCHRTAAVSGDNFSYVWNSLGLVGIIYGILVVSFFSKDVIHLVKSGASRSSVGRGTKAKISGLGGKRSTDPATTPSADRTGSHSTTDKTPSSSSY